jgi:hypothetical protein
MLFANSMMFGADLVGVADIVGVCVANISLQARCGLRGWCGAFLFVFVPFAYDAIIASKRPTSKAILLNTSSFNLAASSKLNPAGWSYAGAYWATDGGWAWNFSTCSFRS